MAGQISEAIKQKRRQLAMAEQHRIAREISASFVGRTLPVLVEQEATAKELQAARINSWEHGLLREASADDAVSVTPSSGRCLIARGEADAPDIDGRIFVRGRVAPGQFAQVRIVGHTDYDLVAVPA
jgi:ribosomal protein S12 methylthiotransferase